METTIQIGSTRYNLAAAWYVKHTEWENNNKVDRIDIVYGTGPNQTFTFYKKDYLVVHDKLMRYIDHGRLI